MGWDGIVCRVLCLEVFQILDTYSFVEGLVFVRWTFIILLPP